MQQSVIWQGHTDYEQKIINIALILVPTQHTVAQQLIKEVVCIPVELHAQTRQHTYRAVQDPVTVTDQKQQQIVQHLTTLYMVPMRNVEGKHSGLIVLYAVHNSMNTHTTRTLASNSCSDIVEGGDCTLTDMKLAPLSTHGSTVGQAKCDRHKHYCNAVTQS
eukprot:8288-Heterococcus_DN1.PRE.6